MSQGADLPILPAVEQSLKPFIKSPPEAAHIRRQLSSTLESLIASTDAPTPSLTSQRAVRCLTGNRKAYYNAAVENLRLRKQWAELSSDIVFPTGNLQSQSQSAVHGQSQPQTSARAKRLSRTFGTETTSPSDWTKTYDQVLELRRVFSQLTILNKYQQRITALAQTHQKPLSTIFAEYNQQLPAVPTGGPLASKDNGDDETLLPLEKAVVDARARLENEKKLLGEAKEKAKDLDMQNLPEEVRTAGMLAAKEELEVWLDEQLRLAGEGSGTPKKERKELDVPGSSVPLDDGRVKFDLDAQLEEIKKAYESYVNSREKMLHAFLLANQPVRKEVIPPKTGRDRSSTSGSTGLGSAKGEIPELLGMLEELVQGRERMEELTELMKAMKEGSINAAKELDMMMGKLRSESQLLENYASGGVRVRPKGGLEDRSPFQESIELAKTWEVAAEEAERSTREEVEKDTKYANEKLEEVEKLLSQLRDLLPEEEKPSKKGKKKDVTWRGLRGNVGFDEDF
ncbi:hypothetical protein ABW19_dt0209657 [Dactylella cylindrospora]|nr:hypothetical protein ABW19_dt0209657 [Dactylella cylindrospora]